MLIFAFFVANCFSMGDCIGFVLFFKLEGLRGGVMASGCVLCLQFGESVFGSNPC